jgi:3-(3-hydroxy-phenyl)propionate hydroxylase
MMGPDVDCDLVWTPIYTFQCRRMEKFRHGRVLLAGDAVHQVSPFGARGANSGIQDVDNLCWKLKLVLDGAAPDRLLDSTSDERVYGADVKILNSTPAMEFITPKSTMSKTLRNAVLDLAELAPFARTLAISGLSLNGPDHPDLPVRTRSGGLLPDAPDGFTDHGQTLPVGQLTATDNPALQGRYLGDAASSTPNAKLILINHISDDMVPEQALTLTKSA